MRKWDAKNVNVFFKRRAGVTSRTRGRDCGPSLTLCMRAANRQCDNDYFYETGQFTTSYVIEICLYHVNNVDRTLQL